MGSDAEGKLGHVRLPKAAGGRSEGCTKARLAFAAHFLLFQLHWHQLHVMPGQLHDRAPEHHTL